MPVSSKLVFYRTGSLGWGRMGVLVRRAIRATSRPQVWFWMTLVLDAVIAIAGVSIGHSFNLTGLLAAGPLLACARCNGRMTALAAGYAIALCAIVAAVTGTTRTTLEGYRFGTVLVAGAFAVIAAVHSSDHSLRSTAIRDDNCDPLVLCREVGGRG